MGRGWVVVAAAFAAACSSSGTIPDGGGGGVDAAAVDIDGVMPPPIDGPPAQPDAAPVDAAPLADAPGLDASGPDACPGDADLDGVCDGADVCPGGDDRLDDDFDGVPNDCDVCPGGDDRADFDLDGVPDDCDNCFDVPNPDQLDGDFDGIGDACDAPPAECNPVTQTGCDAGEKCTWVEGTGTKCAPDGTVSAGNACTTSDAGIDDCVAGTLCVFGTCEPICSTAPIDTCEDATCTIFSGVFDDLGFGTTGVCQPSCDILAEMPCPDPSDGCYISTSGWVCVPPFAEGSPGDPCEAANGCKPGAVCLNVDGSGFFCLEACDYGKFPAMTGDDRCEAAELCCGPLEDGSVVGLCLDACPF